MYTVGDQVNTLAEKPGPINAMKYGRVIATNSKNNKIIMLKTLLQPRSLQQRTVFFILIPTFLLLVVISVVGYIFIRSILLNQWGETAIAKLQRTAHQIDMRLRSPKDFLSLLEDGGSGEVDAQLVRYVLKKIERLDGVAAVEIKWPENNSPGRIPGNKKMSAMMGGMHQFKRDRFEVSLPKYNSRLDSRTVSLASEFKTSGKSGVGRVEIIISFEELIGQVIKAPWWKSNKAYLIDDMGNVLVNTVAANEQKEDHHSLVFGSDSVLEQDTLAAMKNSTSGMVFGRGSPPAEVSGFYRLQEAPWTMVVIAPGDKVLQPIIRFKLFYIISFAISTLLILFFIKGATSRTTSRIREITAAAEHLAAGEFGPPLPQTTRDEVGELTRCFNRMTRQLRQRLLLKEAINVAREVQQNLLPHSGYQAEGVSIDGTSIYCDETGGDYFDILRFHENEQKVGVVVGDVVGHGIGAALLMTTVRALLRCRIHQPGSLEEIVGDVNTLLCRDTNRTGSFVTLFYLEIDRRRNMISWVRGGHEPAIVYSPQTKTFSEFKGNGIALGVAPDWQYECNEVAICGEEQLILIGSDGVWEVENGAGEQFGKDRLKKIIRENSHLDPAGLVQVIIAVIDEFKGEHPQHDDITLALIKTW